MNICQSCGGVIGRDCFNPQECAWISQQMQVEQQVQQRLQPEIDAMKEVINRMERALLQIATGRNDFCGPSLDYMQGYRNGQEYQARIARKALGQEEVVR
jgi:hypothetical protein